MLHQAPLLQVLEITVIFDELFVVILPPLLNPFSLTNRIESVCCAFKTFWWTICFYFLEVLFGIVGFIKTQTKVEITRLKRLKLNDHALFISIQYYELQTLVNKNYWDAGTSLHFLIQMSTKIFKYDLSTKKIPVIHLPPSTMITLSPCMATEDGYLGFVGPEDGGYVFFFIFLFYF